MSKLGGWGIEESFSNYTVLYDPLITQASPLSHKITHTNLAFSFTPDGLLTKIEMIPLSDIKFPSMESSGEGSYADVYQGIWNNTFVAVKKLRFKVGLKKTFLCWKTKFRKNYLNCCTSLFRIQSTQYPTSTYLQKLNIAKQLSNLPTYLLRD